MSFSADVKNELARLSVGDKASAVAECYGVLLFCNHFDARGIRVVTSCAPFGARLVKLFRRAFGVAFDEQPDGEAQGRMVFTINDREKLLKILTAFGYEPKGAVNHHINFGILEDEATRQSFVRGAFFASGSVTDPEKRYHLEMVTDHYSVSREMHALLFEMGFEPKSIPRSGNYVIYLKSSSIIEDFLTTIGAPVAAMDIMSAKVYKGVTNTVNRRVNCDTANVTKTVNAALLQLEAIKKIEMTVGLGALPDKLRQTAVLRAENPDMSLAQLAEISTPPVSKSCLSHRLAKIVEFSRAADGSDDK